MNHQELISKAREQFPSDAALARALGIDPTWLNKAKNGPQPLPLAACGKLADLLGMDRFDVAAINDLLKEKNEARRAYLDQFTRHAMIIIVGIISAGFAKPSPADAAQPSHISNNDNDNFVYYVKYKAQDWKDA